MEAAEEKRAESMRLRAYKFLTVLFALICLIALAWRSFAWTNPTQDPPNGSPGPVVPVSVIISFGGSTAPTGWLLCNGQAVSRTTYANLFAAIGTTYGAGDGSTTFNLPNLKGRVIAGRDSTAAEFDVLGEMGGEKTHTLTITEMPSHTHIQNTHTHIQNQHRHSIDADGGTQDSSGPYVRFDSNESGDADSNYTTATNQNTTAVNQNTGGGGAHNNLQPYIVLNYIIKY